jgi:hypothetical protein
MGRGKGLAGNVLYHPEIPGRGPFVSDDEVHKESVKQE